MISNTFHKEKIKEALYKELERLDKEQREALYNSNNIDRSYDAYYSWKVKLLAYGEMYIFIKDFIFENYQEEIKQGKIFVIDDRKSQKKSINELKNQLS